MSDQPNEQQHEEEVLPEHLQSLQTFTEECRGDVERIKAVAAEAKDRLLKRRKSLEELTVDDGDLHHQLLRDSAIDSIDAQLLMLDEQSETASLFVADLSNLSLQAVLHLQAQQEDLDDAVAELEDAMDLADDGDEGDESVEDESVLVPDDGMLFGALLFEYHQVVSSQLAQYEDGSEKKINMQAKLEEVARALGRVEQITLRAEPAQQETETNAGESSR